MAPKCKSSDAGNLDMPKRSCKVLPLSEKVKVLDKEEKKSSAEAANIYGTNESVKLWRKKKLVLVLLSHLQLSKWRPQYAIKCLIKMEKALHLSVEDMNRKRVPVDGNTLLQKALSLYKDFRRDLQKQVTPSQLLQVKVGYTDSWISLNWKM